MCVVTFGGATGIVIGAGIALVLFILLSRLLRTIPAIDAAWIGDSVHGRFARAFANTLTRAATAVATPDVQYVER